MGIIGLIYGLLTGDKPGTDATQEAYENYSFHYSLYMAIGSIGVAILVLGGIWYSIRAVFIGFED